MKAFLFAVPAVLAVTMVSADGPGLLRSGDFQAAGEALSLAVKEKPGDVPVPVLAREDSAGSR